MESSFEILIKITYRLGAQKQDYRHIQKCASNLRGSQAPGARLQIKWKCQSLSHSDSATPWTVALQVALSMGFSRQEWAGVGYWSGLPCPPPGDLPSRPRDWTQVSGITVRAPIWATRGAPIYRWAGSQVPTRGPLANVVIHTALSSHILGEAWSSPLCLQVILCYLLWLYLRPPLIPHLVTLPSAGSKVSTHGYFLAW